MRQLKFRAWAAGRLWRVHSIDFGNSDELGTRVNIADGGRLGFPVDSVILQQATGLKDKNNKDIYEGDVITFRPKSNKPPFYIVQYDSDKSGFFPFDMKYKRFLEDDEGLPVFLSYEDCRVIGNIYENPELLK